MTLKYYLTNSPLLGYFFQGLYYLIIVFCIKFNFIIYPISDFALLVFYTSLFSQLLNLGNNLSISYFLPKERNKNYAPYILYSTIILTTISFLFFISNIIIDYNKIININFFYLVYLVFFTSLNKILNSIILSLKEYIYYFYLNLIKLIGFSIIYFFTKNIYNILTIVEVIFFLTQFFIIHSKIRFNYFFNFKKFKIFLNHGLSVFWGNFLYDFLFKIDLLIFSIFLPKYQQNELALSIIIFEYFYQIIYVIRLSLFTNITLIFENKIKNKENRFRFFTFSLKNMLKKFNSIILLFSIFSLVILSILYFLKYIGFLTFLNIISLILAVLITKFGHSYQLVFNQIGYPFTQSLYFLITIIFVSLIYYIHILLFSFNFIYIASFISTLFIGINVNFFLKFIEYYESNRTTTKRVL